MRNTLLLFAGLLLAPLAGLSAADSKPNVLLILSDDHSYPHVGCYGKDPNEFTNLAGTPEAASVERELKATLQEWMILQRDFLPLPVPSRRVGNRGEK